MFMQINVNVQISNRLRQNLQRLPSEIKEKIKQAVILTALTKIETPAKQNCKVDTGRLRASIHTSYKSYNERYNYRDNEGQSFNESLNVNPVDNNTYFDVFVGTGVNYAQKIERLYPYLFPAFENSKRFLNTNIKNALRNI
jgi:hypothetical protein